MIKSPLTIQFLMKLKALKPKLKNVNYIKNGRYSDIKK